MDNLLDKTIIFILCLGLMALTGFTTPAIIGMLVAVSLSATFELPKLPVGVKWACPLLYCLLIPIIPSFLVFLPLSAGDLFRSRPLWLRCVWLLPLFVFALMPGLLTLEVLYAGAAVCLSVLSCVLSWRSLGISKQQDAARIARDDLAQASHNLEVRNRDLLERQELELELATLGERSRIAREIHDNVGHLLTRSILQIKALAVAHRGNVQLTSELGHVSDTLDIAFETVRKSIHNLYEESSGLETQLEALARSNDTITVIVDYRGDAIPTNVSISILAMVREALSNTQRHSDATKVQISVVEFPGLYQLLVHDNGSVDPGQVSGIQKGGMGLVSMAERVRALGGILRTSYDKGFKVLVTIPKEREKHANSSHR